LGNRGAKRGTILRGFSGGGQDGSNEGQQGDEQGLFHPVWLVECGKEKQGKRIFRDF
jgi:hypothetical protein